MDLQTLLAEFVDEELALDLVPQGISMDTRLLKAGELFFAVKGHSQDGRAYLQEAILAGACALVVEAIDCQRFLDRMDPAIFTAPAISTIPIIKIKNLQSKLSKIAGRYYGDPSHSLKVIGVTGTNGKTTITTLLAHALSALGCPCALIGTITHTLTTPDPISLQAQLALYKSQGYQAVAMEVSSHALDQDRVAGVRFESAIFTQISHDHLDYHGTIENYAQAKKKLFTMPIQHMILNAEDAHSLDFASHAQLNTQIIFYDRRTQPHVDSKRAITVAYSALDQEGIQARVLTPWGEVDLRSPLLGAFNLSNLLAVLAELSVQGFSLQAIAEVLRELQGPPGRMQRIGSGQPLILIDYAHTPDALLQILNNARTYCAQQLWCVVGCGGDRDRLKRAKIGLIAAQGADRVILTNDNPRSEPPQKIIDDILAGVPLPYRTKFIIEADRKKAIDYAIVNAGINDVILIAGKGHETYQQIKNEKKFFSDALCVQNALDQRSEP